MKKILLLSVCLAMAAMAVQAQKDPPPPPAPPKKIDEKVKFHAPPVITITGKKADEFYARNPTVAGISRMGNIVTLTMKDNTTQKYDFNKKEEKETFKVSYGEAPIPDPPPPPKKIDVKVKMPPPPPPPPKPVD